MRKVLSPETVAIRRLNDRLRQTRMGGKVMLSASIAALSELNVAEVLSAVAVFDDFTSDNDPYGEHDCAIVEWQGQRVMFKIDYYDPTLRYHSDDPTDPALTVRVMTVMFADEY